MDLYNFISHINFEGFSDIYISLFNSFDYDGLRSFLKVCKLFYSRIQSLTAMLLIMNKLSDNFIDRNLVIINFSVHKKLIITSDEFSFCNSKLVTTISKKCFECHNTSKHIVLHKIVRNIKNEKEIADIKYYDTGNIAFEHIFGQDTIIHDITYYPSGEMESIKFLWGIKYLTHVNRPK